MSKRSLSDSEVKEIRRLFATGRYTKVQLGIKYYCSNTTIALWLPKDSSIRELKFIPTIKDKICKKCGEDLKIHKRCKLCTILLHDNNICDCEL